MIALLYFAFFGAYLLISVLFVYLVVKFAKKNGFNPWLPGIAAAVAMYMIVFWDFIPVLVKHNNLCKEQGGYWIYKTPEQWFKENPDAIGKNWGDRWNDVRYENVNGKSRSWLSDYMYLETYFDRDYAHAICKYESQLIDAKTGQVLAKMVDFERGGGNPMLQAKSITDYKYWLGLGSNTCRVNAFGDLVTKIKSMGGKN